ncbi:retrovirus-related Pol polyprotein from transposon 297 [Nephila pilipes]|uniref:Retrovirus-related Pol polyprotein from transposon 297 n=1 Tax=Nephila pilipes TaxID=299642 RepID=A0A8X6IZU7_NEPPI|nr:retrovirus-related Pol polyprotein from transposon 297 [Nephila pilipes]
MQLGDRKPSRFLLEMRSTAGNRMPEELLKSLFLQRLPTHLQQILAIFNDQLEKLAEMVDGIMAPAGHTSSIDAENQELKTMLIDISSRLESREHSTSHGPERRFRHRSASRNSVPLIETSKHRPPASLQLFAARGTVISTYGQRLLTLDFGFRKVFRWPFIIAEVSQPTIGANFLRHYGLTVDIRHECLVDSLTKLQTQGTVQQCQF